MASDTATLRACSHVVIHVTAMRHDGDRRRAGSGIIECDVTFMQLEKGPRAIRVAEAT
jgi:hypothetical protein